MEWIVEFAYIMGVGLLLSYLVMVVYVSLWGGDDDE